MEAVCAAAAPLGAVLGHPESVSSQLCTTRWKEVHTWERNPSGFREAGRMGVQERMLGAVGLWDSPLSPCSSRGRLKMEQADAVPHRPGQLSAGSQTRWLCPDYPFKHPPHCRETLRLHRRGPCPAPAMPSLRVSRGERALMCEHPSSALTQNPRPQTEHRVGPSTGARPQPLPTPRTLAFRPDM